MTETLLFQRVYPEINLKIRATSEAVASFYSAMGYQEDEIIVLGNRIIYDR